MLGAWPHRLALFLAAGLLFTIQPVVAKALLPQFGGTALVWSVVLTFFQAALLLGYGLAFAIAHWLPSRAQVITYAAFLVAAAAQLPIDLGDGRPAFSPVLALLATLAYAVLAPAVVLAATSPLLQSWAQTGAHRSPYRLFAFSNAGSLLGLLLYPLVIEPALAIPDQLRVWSWGFWGFMIVALLCGALPWRSRSPVARAPADDRPTLSEGSFWFGLAAAGVIVMLAATTELTTNVAPFPLLWVVPLALYLVSFVLAFAGVYRRRFWLGLFAASILPTLWLGFVTSRAPLLLVFVVHVISVFSGCMVCHGELYQRRPSAAHLTLYYLVIAIGGATGGLFVSIVAPAVFERVYEHMIGLWLAFFLAVFSLPTIRNAKQRLPALALIAVFGALAVFAGALPMTQKDRTSLVRRRSPYAVLEVVEENVDGRIRRRLIHGDILHGSQWQAEKDRRIASEYYQSRGGIGVILGRAQRPAMRIGVVGLGAGAIAAYGGQGDVIRFYEIDSVVEEIARGYFSFLDDSLAAIEIVIGDARMSLQRELESDGGHEFDVLVLDAFSSGAVPVHLLTVEAFRTYFAHLAPSGLILVNVASTYVDTAAVSHGAAVHLGASSLVLEAAPSVWLVITKEPGVFSALGGEDIARSISRAVLWSDEYSDLTSVLYW